MNEQATSGADARPKLTCFRLGFVMTVQATLLHDADSGNEPGDSVFFGYTDPALVDGVTITYLGFVAHDRLVLQPKSHTYPV